VVMAGDLNASWFDDKIEEFFDELHEGDWAVLAKDGYPGTRLAGHPLEPRSQIDYLVVSKKTGTRGGLFNEEITQDQATVHQDLTNGNWRQFRQRYSDHFPVTSRSRIRCTPLPTRCARSPQMASSSVHDVATSMATSVVR